MKRMVRAEGSRRVTLSVGGAVLSYSEVLGGMTKLLGHPNADGTHHRTIADRTRDLAASRPVPLCSPAVHAAPLARSQGLRFGLCWSSLRASREARFRRGVRLVSLRSARQTGQLRLALGVQGAECVCSR